MEVAFAVKESNLCDAGVATGAVQTVKCGSKSSKIATQEGNTSDGESVPLRNCYVPPF